MMLSLFYFSFWVVMRGADSVRPSALHRGYVFIWLYTITWILLIGVTVLQDRFRIASGYPFVFLHSATFFCLLHFPLRALRPPGQEGLFGRRERRDGGKSGGCLRKGLAAFA